MVFKTVNIIHKIYTAEVSTMVEVGRRGSVTDARSHFAANTVEECQVKMQISFPFGFFTEKFRKDQKVKLGIIYWKACAVRLIL